VILYEMLLGQVPFSGGNIYEVLRKVVEEEPRRPSTVSRRIPRELETICLKALEKEPARRYASAGEFGEDIRRHLQGKPIRARQLGALGTLWRRAKRKKAVVIPAAAAAVVVLGVIVALAVLSVKRAAEVRREIAQANELVRWGKYARARDILIGVLKKERENAEARELLAKVEEKLKEIARRMEQGLAEARKRQRAMELVAQGERDMSASLVYLYRKGPLELMRKELSGAMESFDKALKICPELSEAWEAKGRAWEFLFYPEKALSASTGR
jgi:tetratricopeptide (TPR) repeat protein